MATDFPGSITFAWAKCKQIYISVEWNNDIFYGMWSQGVTFHKHDFLRLFTALNLLTRMCCREKTSMWKKVLNMLAAFIPLGLFLAALPPNILTINTTQ